MNISDIWDLSNERLHRLAVLVTKNQNLSDNRNFDRTVVTTILYNDGKIDIESSLLVEHPIFNEIMSEPLRKYRNSINILIQNKVIVLQPEEAISGPKIFSKLFTDISVF